VNFEVLLPIIARLRTSEESLTPNTRLIGNVKWSWPHCGKVNWLH
jgi:hypothetical protein